MLPGTEERTNIFISYSHHDIEWLNRLRIHLRPIERSHTFTIWDDTIIKPGSKWNEEIQDALKITKVAILLISADFLASDFIITEELPQLLEAAEKKGAVILPVVISPSRYTKIHTLSQFQAINDPLKPMINLSRGEQEEIFVKVTECVENELNRAEKEADTWNAKRHNDKQQILKQLNRLITEGGKDNFLIVSAREFFVQFSISKGETELYCETVSNQFLPEILKLKNTQVQELITFGFNVPNEKTPNFFTDFGFENETDYEHVAETTISIFFSVFKIPETSKFSFKINLE